MAGSPPLCEQTPQVTLSPLVTHAPLAARPMRVRGRVSFSSPRPVSFTTAVWVRDGDGRSFALWVSATADNSLLSSFPFLAEHQADHLICAAGGQVRALS